MSAAHCFYHLQGISNDDIRVVTGDSQRYVDEATETTYNVCGIKLHKGFNRFTFANDIMLLKLCCKVEFSHFVRKGCLPQAGDELYYRAGAQCVVAGWGGTVQKNGTGVFSLRPSTSLKQANLPVADIEICKRSTRYPVAETSFCAGDGTGQAGPCRGDSGGPIFCMRKDSDTYVVTGIVSWGVGCGQAGQYGFYTDLRKLRQWIEDNVEGCSSDPCPDSGVNFV